MQPLDHAQPQITVGVDSSPALLAALRWAHEQAIRRSATLIVLTVWPAAATGDLPTIATEDHAHAVATSAIDSVLGRDGRSAKVWVTHYPSDPADALLRRARKSELVVVGPHSAHTVTEHLLGSVTERLLGEAACPVAVIHARRPRRRTESSWGSTAHLPHRPRWTGPPARPSSPTPRSTRWDWRPEYGVHPYGPPEQLQEEHARAVLDRAVAALRPESRSLTTAQLVRGHPAHVLLAAAEDADLLVVGNNRGGPLAERVLGSVSRRLALTSRQPVVVTHAPPGTF